MIASLAIALLVQEPVVPLRLQQLDVPIMGGIREIVVGPVARQNDTLGLFINNLDLMTDQNGGKAPSNFNNPRIGSLSSAVRVSLLGSTETLMVDTESTRTQTLKIGYENIDLRMKMSRKWFVNLEGRIISESFRLEAGGNVWTCDVKYDQDTYTAYLSSPDRGRRTLGPVTPFMGMDEVTTTAFKPMVKLPDEIVLREKSFYMIDPFTGGPVKYLAKYRGKFAGTFIDDRVRGHEFEITGGVEKQIVSITNGGWVVKAVLEKYKYLSFAGG